MRQCPCLWPSVSSSPEFSATGRQEQNISGISSISFLSGPNDLQLQPAGQLFGNSNCCSLISDPDERLDIHFRQSAFTQLCALELVEAEAKKNAKKERLTESNLKESKRKEKSFRHTQTYTQTLRETHWRPRTTMMSVMMPSRGYVNDPSSSGDVTEEKATRICKICF